MYIHKAYKFRMYPSNEQVKLINKTIGCNRLIYNYYLNKKKELYETSKETISYFECNEDIPNLCNEYPFLKEVDSISFRCTLKDLDNAYNKFIKENKGYPRYKNRNSKNSYRTNYITSTYKGNTYQNIKLDLEKRVITLPKLKEVKIRGYRKLSKIEGRIINATISKECDNTYYVSILYEQDIELPKTKIDKAISIDLGIKDLVITSDYEKYTNEKAILKYENRIKRIQKRLSKKIKGSNNYIKTKEKLARLYKKIKNTRKYNIHRITKEIVDNNDIIVTEKLKVKNMIQSHKIAKTLTDASFSEIIRQLTYKSKWKNKRLIQVDTYYPSSQICSVCGYKNEKTKDLNVREYVCPECGSNHDRDYNASINIMYEGIIRHFKNKYGY